MSAHKRFLRAFAASSLFYTGALRLLESKQKFPWRILMYHRVVEPAEVDYPLQPGMYVTPETFRKQLEFLSRHTAIVPLEELVAQIARGQEIPPRTIAITFDDGWVDNYQHAYP